MEQNIYLTFTLKSFSMLKIDNGMGITFEFAHEKSLIIFPNGYLFWFFNQ